MSGTRCAAAAIARITLVDGRSIASKSIGDDSYKTLRISRQKIRQERNLAQQHLHSGSPRARPSYRGEESHGRSPGATNIAGTLPTNQKKKNNEKGQKQKKANKKRKKKERGEKRRMDEPRTGWARQRFESETRNRTTTTAAFVFIAFVRWKE